MFVEVKNLSFSYSKSENLNLNNLNLSIEKGSKVCILGESGSGKSTFLRLLAGLEEPNSGYIQVDDVIMASKENFIPPERRGIGMVFQDYALFPNLTVSQNIVFGLKNIKKNEKMNLLNEMLGIVELYGYENRYPYELSGGQQQRVALARALILRPKLLLLDEPLCNLDASLKEKIREELRVILDKAMITTIFVTHDKEDCIKLSDYVVVLKNGETMQQGLVNEVLMKPKTAYVKALLA